MKWGVLQSLSHHDSNEQRKKKQKQTNKQGEREKKYNNLIAYNSHINKAVIIYGHM